jgi:hypothetical protein
MPNPAFERTSTSGASRAGARIPLGACATLWIGSFAVIRSLKMKTVSAVIEQDSRPLQWLHPAQPEALRAG